MGSYLKVEVWRGARATDSTDLNTSLYTRSGSYNDAVWVKMAVKRKDSTAIRKGMLDDDHALITAPAKRLGIGNQAVPDAINRRAETGSPAGRPPILTGVITVVSTSPNSEILPTSSDVHRIGWINRKVKCIDDSAGSISKGRGSA
jgi:hypothetical protein